MPKQPKQQPEGLKPTDPGSSAVVEGRVQIQHVVGLDTASDRWHAFSIDPKYRMHCHLTGKAWKDPDDRRHTMYLRARAYLGALPARTLVACEEPLGLSKNGKTTRLLGMAAGAIWAAHLDTRVFWVWVDIAAWKKRVVGNGNADKAAIREWALSMDSQLLEDQDPETVGIYDHEPDYYDAMAIAVYARMCLNDTGQ